jgi:hypothetical protein
MPSPSVSTLRHLTAPIAARAACAAWVLVSALVAASVAQAQTPRGVRASGGSVFDLVLVNGRVIDPETGLDGVRSVGIRS